MWDLITNVFDFTLICRGKIQINSRKGSMQLNTYQMARYFFWIFSLLVFAQCTRHTTYYIDPSGDDKN
jgi:hypothetical protein